MMHTTLGGGSSTWFGVGTLVSLAFWIGVVLLSVWLFRFVKDNTENKRLLGWGLGLVIGVSILVSLFFWSLGSGMMGTNNGWGMTRGMIGTPGFQQFMVDHMQQEFQEWQEQQQ